MVKGKVTSPTTDRIAGALSICLTLLALIRTGGQLGGAFNPVVGQILTFHSLSHLDNENEMLSHYMYAYTIGPMIGGALAGLFYRGHKKHYETMLKGQ